MRSRLLREMQEFPVSYNVVPKTGAYNMLIRDVMVKVDPVAGSFTITLPAVAEVAGGMYTIKQVTPVNTVTINDRGDSKTVISQVLASATAAAIYYSDGEQWYLVYLAA